MTIRSLLVKTAGVLLALTTSPPPRSNIRPSRSG